MGNEGEIGQLTPFLTKLYCVKGSIPMKRNLWARIDKPLKLGLLILLFSCVSIIGSVETSYAMSSKLLVSPPILPTPIDILPSPKPTSTPAPTPAPPIPTPAATQPPQAIPTPQV